MVRPPINLGHTDPTRERGTQTKTVPSESMGGAPRLRIRPMSHLHKRPRPSPRAILLILAVVFWAPKLAHADVNIWLSDVGTINSGVQTSVHGAAYAPSTSTGQVYVWIRTNSAAQDLTAIELNLVSTNSAVLDFTSVTVHNPEHVVGGCTSSTTGCRWHFTTEPTADMSPDEISGLNAGVITNGAGIGANGVTAGDSLYDTTADAWLFATVDFSLTANGSTDLFWQIGDNGMAGVDQEAIDIDVVFGDPNDASLNAQSQRNTNSETADSSFRFGAAQWDGDTVDSMTGNGTTWGDDNNWTTLGIQNQGPTASFPGDAVVLATAPTVGVIDLGADRLAHHITFEDDYTLNNQTLTLTSGNVSVDPGVAGTIHSNISATSGIFSKLGSGTLTVGGTVTDTSVVAGTLRGTGTLASLTIESGSNLAPGNSTGTLTVTGSYTQSSGGLLAVEIAGTTSSTTYDVVSVGGTATLAGTLEIQTDGSFTPADGTNPGDFGDSFVILSASAVAGTFGADVGRHVGNGRFYFITYNATDVTLDAFQALGGDANGDLKIDITDFNILSTNFDPGGTTNGWTDADFDGDGDVDITDFNLLSANFAPSNYGDAGPVSVPEPGVCSSFLLVLLTLFVCRKEWR